MYSFLIEYTIGQEWKHKTVRAENAFMAKMKAPLGARNIRAYKVVA